MPCIQNMYYMQKNAYFAFVLGWFGYIGAQYPKMLYFAENTYF